MTAKCITNKAKTGIIMKRRFSIRTRVLTFIFILLFSTFSLTGVIFNIAVWQYIQSNAIMQLTRSYNVIQEAMEIAESILLEFPRELFNDRTEPFALRRYDFHIQANMFVLDSDYNPLGVQFISNRSSEILEVIKHKGINLNNMRNRRINTASGTYYVSSYQLPVIHTAENAYLIIYADITGLSNFARTINMFLIILVCAMFIAAAFVVFYLSKSITNPIQKLCMLAINIGQGDFTPKDYRFKEREFEDLNLALNKSAKQLSIYDNEQKTFFQNVSHELRTPLMSIQCYAEGISCGLMEPQKASDTILQETNRLNEMVKDLLYISKIDNITSTYTITKVDLHEIIRECAQRQQVLADKKNLRFSFAFDKPAVYFDCAEELIKRAIENLISNAIRYASSTITLSCRKTAGQVEICVTDDGTGVGAEIMPYIFERFHKGKGGNYGIGLSIVKSIVEQHGGNIKAENINGGGAAFTMIMPCENRR